MVQNHSFSVNWFITGLRLVQDKFKAGLGQVKDWFLTSSEQFRTGLIRTS